MSAPHQHWYGVVPLKPGVTLQDIVTLYGSDELVLGDEWSDPDLKDHGTADLAVENGELIVDFDGDYGWSWSSGFEDFLNAVAEQYAAAGWTSYEGEDEDRVYYGPTTAAVDAAALAQLFRDLTTALVFYNDRAKKLGATPMVLIEDPALRTYQQLAGAVGGPDYEAAEASQQYY